MSDLKEQAKKIIAKGKLLNDPELINMGLEMLDVYSGDNEETLEEPRVLMPTKSSSITEQFRVNNSSPIDTKFGRRVAISTSGRENKFVDDKTEAADLIGKTPPPKPKQKRKAVSKVEVTCLTCGKKEKILKELLFTESYRCDSCILKGK